MIFQGFFQLNHDFLWQALEPALAGLVLWRRWAEPRVPCSVVEFHIWMLNPSVPISSIWRGFAIHCQVGQQDSRRDKSRDLWRGLAGRTPWLLGSFIPMEMRIPVSQTEVTLQDPAEGLAGVGVPSLQPTSCMEVADGLVEEFGCWGPISQEEARSAHPGMPLAL